jgi:hypothetical protein
MALASFEQQLKLIISRKFLFSSVINKQDERGGKKSDEDEKSEDRHDRISMMMELLPKYKEKSHDMSGMGRRSARMF